MSRKAVTLGDNDVGVMPDRRRRSEPHPPGDQDGLGPFRQGGGPDADAAQEGVTAKTAWKAPTQAATCSGRPSPVRSKAAKARSTQSEAWTAAGPTRVVMTFLLRTAPPMRLLRMRRIIVQRATALACRFSSRQTFLALWTRHFPCSGVDGRCAPPTRAGAFRPRPGSAVGRCAESVTAARYRPGRRYQLADRATAGGDSAPTDSGQSGVSIRACTVQRSTHGVPDQITGRWRAIRLPTSSHGCRTVKGHVV